MTDDNNTPRKKKRQLRPAVTIREKAAKTSKKQRSIKPPRLKSITRPIFKPFRQIVSFLGKYRTFRIIGKILSFLGRIILPKYFRNSWREIKLVTWPSRRESIRLTVAVLGFAIVFGAVLASLDFGLSHLFKLIILGNHH